MINSVHLVGILTQDPEFTSGVIKSRDRAALRVRVDSLREDSRGTPQRHRAIIPVICWGPLARSARAELARGSIVAVTGSIEQRKIPTGSGVYLCVQARSVAPFRPADPIDD